MPIVHTNHKSRFDVELHRGDMTNMTQWYKFGHCPLVGTTHADLWQDGGSYPWPTVASTLEAVSDNAADTAAGAGCRTILVQGLDENFDEVEETITMNGTSASTATTATFIRVNRVYAVGCGAYSTTLVGGPTGVVTVRKSGGGVTLATIASNGTSRGQSEMSMFTIPAGKTGNMCNISITVETNKTAEVVIWQRRGADQIIAPFISRRVVNEYHGVGGHVAHDFVNSISFPEKTDIWVSALVSSGTAEVEITYSMLVIDYDPRTAA